MLCTLCRCQVTYHGPGQLVMYPILDLRCGGAGDSGSGSSTDSSTASVLRPDLHWYLRSLEEVVIRWALRRGAQCDKPAGPLCSHTHAPTRTSPRPTLPTPPACRDAAARNVRNSGVFISPHPTNLPRHQVS